MHHTPFIALFSILVECMMVMVLDVVSFFIELAASFLPDVSIRDGSDAHDPRGIMSDGRRRLLTQSWVGKLEIAHAAKDLSRWKHFAHAASRLTLLRIRKKRNSEWMRTLSCCHPAPTRSYEHIWYGQRLHRRKQRGRVGVRNY